MQGTVFLFDEDMGKLSAKAWCQRQDLIKQLLGVKLVTQFTGNLVEKGSA
jgi:hypothetical protein